MKELIIETVPYYDDNFSYLIHDDQAHLTALVDCGEIDPVLERLEKNKWGLDYILITHSHFDHAGEIENMKKHFPDAVVVKPDGEKRLPAAGLNVKEGDTVTFGQREIEVVSLPAHTMFCTAYHIDGNLFVGDAFFSAGCGRLFEGQPADLERAMDKIASFSDRTKIYFGHEYTQANIRFARTIDPGNMDLASYQKSVDRLIGSGRFSTPTTLELEKRINPFLRIDRPAVAAVVDPGNERGRTERMGVLRMMKDNF
ncbi:hydroxyacylglutathione hydrolase [bacterium]|nr:hydroxyacylglutathione hydrolase [bacterium]